MTVAGLQSGLADPVNSHLVTQDSEVCPMPFKNLTGKRFGRLTVTGFAKRDRHGHASWFCNCSCGNNTIVHISNLASGHTQSCGCLMSEVIAARLRHGDTREKRTPEYRIWTSMIQRCINPNVRKYPNYGGRGIKVCDRWRYSYQNFLADIGRRPSSKFSIDRINNDGNYEPGNCHWATAKEQRANQRKRCVLTSAS